MTTLKRPLPEDYSDELISNDPDYVWHGFPSFFSYEEEYGTLYDGDAIIDQIRLDTGIAVSNTSVLTDAPDAGYGPRSGVHNDEGLICFGTVYRTRVKLIGNMVELTSKLHSKKVSEIGFNYVFPTVYRQSGVVITLPDGHDVAVGNKQLNEAFAAPFPIHCVQLEALARTGDFHEAISTATKASDAQALVSINVYGTLKVAAEVGGLLSKHKVWLQRPDWHRPRVTYENPHELKFPGGVNHEDRCTIAEPVNEDSDTIQSLAEDILSTLTRGAHLQRLEGDSRLRTKLLPHQEEALDFMIQRENGPIAKEFQLWSEIDEGGQTWYRHKITGIKSSTLRPEIGGGIIADEMGMGKTFEILALLIRTLNEAHEWSVNDTTHLSSQISPTKILSRATLVVVPSPLLLNSWNYEIEQRLDAKLKVITYHGQRRPDQIVNVADSDIVLTTYHTLMAERTRGDGLVTQIGWFRIVLDEAHFIRRQSTLLHQRVAELDANHRWCLTGTPIQNSLDDIGALLVFIRAYPFDRLGFFRKYITSPFNEGGLRRNESTKRLSMLIDSVCIRRTKELLHLRGHEEIVRLIEFSPEERQQYERTGQDMDRKLRHITGESDNKSHFGSIQAHLHLRMLCNHGTFQHQFSWASTRKLIDRREHGRHQIDREGEILCSACGLAVATRGFGSGAGQVRSGCSHVLCLDCSEDIGYQCPLCEATLSTHRAEHVTADGQPRLSRERYFRPHGYSSKMAVLMTEIYNNLETTKGIVFSCWTTTLDLVAIHLKQSAVPFERIDGDASFKHRQQILDRFDRDPSLPILIMTTGVGAFGLNLTAANRIYLIEPQWNPSVENQAIGRVLRLGQDREVVVTRYIINKTVEQAIQVRQREKRRIARIADSSQVAVKLEVS